MDSMKHASILSYNSALQRKKWRTKPKSERSIDELSPFLKNQRKNSAVPSLTKQTTIAPLFVKSNVEDKVKKTFHMKNQRTTLQPVLTSKTKPVVLKKNSTSIMCDNSLRLSSKAPKFVPRKQIIINIGPKKSDDNRLDKQRSSFNMPKVSAISDSKGKVVYIGTSPAHKALKERKQKQQQVLKASVDEKIAKFKGEHIRHTKKSAKESKISTNIPLSSYSKSTRIQSTETSLETISTDSSFTRHHKSQKSKIPKESKPDCTMRRRSDKVSASPKVSADSPKFLQKCSKMSPGTIFALSSKTKAINAHKYKSTIIPNIEHLKSRSGLKKFINLSSKSPDRSDHLQSSPKKLLNCSSELKTSSDMDAKFQRNSELLAMPSVLKKSDIRDVAVGNIDYKSHCSSNLSRSTNSIETDNALFNQDVDKEPENLNDVEMIDISVNIESLSSLSCSMELDDLSYSQCYVFVVDTNILIHSLSFLDKLKDTPLQGCGLPYVYIPWIVIQELDGLKSGNSNVKYQAIKAIRYIFSMFNSKHPRIRGQKCKISKEVTRVYGDTNDDAILSFCSILAEKTSQDKLGLLSNDINLCNKAMMIEINAFTTKTLFTEIKPDFQNLHARDCPASSHQDKESSTMIFNNTLKPTAENLTLKSIIYEAKLILKEVLEPFLDESMQNAFPDMKYWISVFGIMFYTDIKKDLETVKLFNHKQGFVYNVDDVITLLIAIENICKAVAVKKPSIYNRILQLIKDCKALGKVEDDYVPADDKSQREITFGVFNYLWSLINHLCGMIMDFANMPHDLIYVKPADTPPISEFQELITNLLPSIHTIKQGMSKVIDITTVKEQDYKRLYKYLLQFAPSLKIQAAPPPAEKFTVQCLKIFMLDPDCREKVKIGISQLQNYEKKISDAVKTPIWKN